MKFHLREPWCSERKREPDFYCLNEVLSVISDPLTAHLHFYCVFVDCVNSELVMRNMS